MKRQILLLIILVGMYVTVRAEFVEQFRSEPNRRFAKVFKNILASDEYFTKDFNGNGVNDRFHIEVDGASGGYLLLVYDGLSKTPLWKAELPEGMEEVGFYKLKGNEVSPCALCTNEVLPGVIFKFIIIDSKTNQIEFSAENARFLGVANIDNDLVPEIFYFDLTTREIVIIEWKEGGNTISSEPSIADNDSKLPAEMSKSNVNYSLTLKFESAPNTTLIYDDSFFEGVNDFDADADGIMDLVLALENQAQQFVGIVVIDGSTKSVKWAFQYPEGQLDEFSNFHGFYDADGNGVKEALFGNRTVVTADKNVYSLSENFEFQAVYDVDNDGYPDLIGIGLQDSTVQVWGIDSPSGINDKDLLAAGFQLQQNYPNPFNPSTRIQYQVSNSSQVSLRIYDVLGNEVTTLVNEYKPAGRYEVDFQSTVGNLQLASGIYLYKLQAGSFVEMKKMILLR
jgi:hypothetical protein